jgi:hypothetical protein
MKTVGWILTIVTGLIIFYNVLQSHENVKQVEEHPWTTLFSDGANLKPSFTFTPPFTPFELTVIAGGVIGVVLIISGGSRAER